MPLDIMCHKRDILYARASLIRHFIVRINVVFPTLCKAIALQNVRWGKAITLHFWQNIAVLYLAKSGSKTQPNQEVS
jgi:hypothetical protein